LTVVALPERMPAWGVLVLESHHAAEFTMPWRTHDFIKVVFAMSGSGRVLIRDTEYRFRSHDVIVVPAGNKNRIIDDPGSAASLYVLCLDTELLRFDPTIDDRVPHGRLRTSVHFASQVQGRLRRLLFEQTQDTPSTPLTMVGDGIQLLSLLIKQPCDSQSSGAAATPERDEVLAYIEHLQTHFFEATTIDEAANQVGLPRRRFTAMFKELAGRSWLKHIRQLRVQHAEQLLQKTDLPITSVAFECGYEDLSTFYRQFKRQTGVAPGIWREHVENNEKGTRSGRI
jgi:AraC-like DNA-binding protein